MITLSKLNKVCKLLNKYCVRYVVIGGCAIFMHGYERTTRDIDLLVDVSDKNIKKLKKALKKILPEACKELKVDDVRKNIVVRMVGKDLIIDLIGKVGSIVYNDVETDLLIQKVKRIKIPIAGLETMLKLKQGIRETDKKDYLFLLGKKRYLEQKRNKVRR